MGVVLKMEDGDLFINEATGRSEEISGPNKVDQELFSLFATTYDADRDWGTALDLSSFTSISSPEEFRAVLFSRVAIATQRILAKQKKDPTLDVETEFIRRFSRIDVVVDPIQGAGFFVVIAEVGDPATTVGKNLAFTFKPIETRHVIPPQRPSGFSFKNP